jgi:ABC-type bacteriocin/lantibiotic exporter with double-glycine peptidase domain
MLTPLRNVVARTDKHGRWQLAVLSFALSAAAVLDVVGVGAIIPFTMMLVQPDALATNPILLRLMRLTGVTSPRELMITLGLATLAVLVIVNAFQTWSTWLLLNFTWQQGRLLSGRLFAAYLSKPYGWFLVRNTSDMVNTLFQEVQRIIGSVLDPALTIVSRGVGALSLIGFLVYLEPSIACGTMLVLGGAYAALYLVVRRVLARASERAKDAREEAHRIATEALGGIKDVKLSALERYYLARYATPSQAMVRHEVITRMMAHAPRYLLETLAIGIFIVGALVLSAPGGDNVSAVPILAAYGFAGYRLMPSLQQIYASFAMLRANLNSLEAILLEIADSERRPPDARVDAQAFANGKIELTSTSFIYPGSDRKIVHDIDLVIEPKTSIAIIGKTGSGKTTLIDIIVGLLPPTSGTVAIDKISLTPENATGWQTQIGYVPQVLYLSDDTIAANIAFGVPQQEIDMDRVVKVARMANLDAFVSGQLEQGYATPVGERGTRLSNGQRQRIGIARALYRMPKVLILDEATSALDYETEQAVLDALNELAHEVTIIMIAHRLHTIEACDAVYEMQEGRLRRIKP